MSCAINVDNITPKSSSNLRIDKAVFSDPLVIPLSAPVNIGSYPNIRTQTGNLTLYGGVWYLFLDELNIGSGGDYNNSAAECPLLVGTPAIPNVDHYLANVIRIEDWFGIGCIKIDTAGIITYYSDWYGSGGWMGNAPDTVRRNVYTYRS